LFVMTAAFLVGAPGPGIAALFGVGVGCIAALVTRRGQLIGWRRAATFGVGVGAIAALVGLVATVRATRPPSIPARSAIGA
jgi:hypothetical protein